MFWTHKALRIRRHLDVVDFIDVFWEYNLVGHSSFCFVFESSFTVRDLSLYPLFWVWTLLSGTLCDVHHFYLVILFYLWVCVCVLSCDCFVSCILSIEILSRIMCCFVLSFTYVWFRVFIVWVLWLASSREWCYSGYHSDLDRQLPCQMRLHQLLKLLSIRWRQIWHKRLSLFCWSIRYPWEELREQWHYHHHIQLLQH